jgi:REP element-mobilizing transposase RayT
MLYNNRYRVASSRLQGYNYSQNGAYFITFCTKSRYPWFGTIRNGMMCVNAIGAIVNQFKSICTKHIRHMGYPNFAWQPRYHDHIIRNQSELHRIRKYIIDNPKNWKK